MRERATTAMDIRGFFRSKVLIPRDPGAKTASKRSRNGILLPDDSRTAIVAAAREVGVLETSIPWASA
ncbi:hypothetical protein XH89_26950 [Bradyrhizobium sp. CCBAU 53340]|nr:hypothetical protein XH89_26950 [Bradyrhizobium sp. CCBAU 53340]